MNGLTHVRQGSIAAVLTALLVLASTGYGAPIPLTNGVPATGLSGAASSETIYSITVPAGQDELIITISGSTGDCDMYVKKDATPTTTNWDYRPFLPGSNETVDVTSPAAGTWYIMLRGYTAYSNLTLVATYSSSVHTTALTNNVPVTGLSGASGSETYFTIDVPAGQTKLEISIADGTGDCDLYVKKDAMPTVSSYDYRPFLSRNNEKVSITDPAAGTWYIMLRGYNAYSGLTLLAAYSGNVGTLLVNGVPVTGLSGAANSESLYRIEVPAGQLALEILITGGTGDCDLYVKRGAPPTVTSYDYRPFVAGNEETVNIDNPAADTWYIMLRGYSDYTGVTLKATYGGVATLTDGVPVTGISGALNSERYYQLDVPDGCSDLLFSISGGTGNCDLYVRLGAMPTTSTYDFRPYLPGNDETVLISTPHSGTWYVMLKGRQAYSGVTLLGDYTVASTVRTLVNGVPVTGLSGAQGSETLYQIIVPSGQTSLVIQISGGTGDCDMYVKRDAAPTTTSWDYRPYENGNNETVTVASPTAGTWYIMLRGFNAYSGLTLVATYTGGGGGGGDVTLSNGVPVTGLSGATGSYRYFLINVPTGQGQLNIVTSGGSGDADMYIRLNTKPTTTQWDYHVAIAGNNESISFGPPASGTWYILLYGVNAYSNVTLVATYTAASEPVIELTNGVPVTGISGAQDSLKYFKINVPSGQDYLHFATSGGTGDVDLTVKRGSKPTLISWDYNSSLPGNDETIDVSHPASGTWYILLNGFTSYAGVTLVASYGVTPVPTGNIFTTDPNCVAVWRMEPGALTVDSRGTNTLTNVGVVSSTTDFQEGTGSAVFESSAADRLIITDGALSANFPTKNGTTAGVFSGTCWLKLNSLTSTGYLMSKYMPPTSQMSWGIGSLYNGAIIFRIGYNNGHNMEYQETSPSNVMHPGRWYHVGFTFNSSTRSCYVRVYDKSADSILINETLTFTHDITVTAAAFVMGGTESPDTGYSLNGLLDEAVVFNDLLTPTQIDQIRQGIYGH
jgi:hypothetical protein